MSGPNNDIIPGGSYARGDYPALDKALDEMGSPMPDRAVVDDDFDLAIWLTEKKAKQVFYALTNIRDCNLLSSDEVEAIEFLNTEIARGLREHAEGLKDAEDALRAGLRIVMAERNANA